MKKIFVLAIFVFLFIPFNTFAISPTLYSFYNINYGVIRSGNVTQSTGEWQSSSATNVARVRYNFNYNFKKNCTYTMSWTNGFSASKYWESSNALSQIGINGSLVPKLSENYQITFDSPSGSYYRREIASTIQFESPASVTSAYYEIQFSNYPLNLDYFLIPNFSIIQNSCDNSQDIIDNQNQNQQQTNERLDKIDDTLNDDNVDDASKEATSFFDDFINDDHGLGGFLNSMIGIVEKFSSAKCEPLEFQLPFVHDEVSLQCMKPIYQEHFGAFFTLWQMITTGLISYNVIINLYSKVRQLQNPNSDRIEVLNL